MGMKIQTIKNLNLGEILHKDLGIINNRRWAEFTCTSCNLIFKSRVDTLKTSTCNHCTYSNAKTIHGEHSTKLYEAWQNMKTRIHSTLPKMKLIYEKISICNEWKSSYINFSIWAKNNGYINGLKLDRIDNDGNYEPSNCRWTTQFIQSRNTRILRSTNKSGYRGVSWSKQKQKWRTTITINYKQKNLGFFTDQKEAGKAYDNFIIKHNLEHTINNIG